MQAPDPLDEDRKDMQALIAAGLASMRFSEYVLLDVTCARDARAWLQEGLPFVWGVADLRPRQARCEPPQQVEEQEAWSIAFTYRGLTRLGITEDEEAPFPSEFRAGQADPIRRKLLREDMDAQWCWGDVAKPGAKRAPQPVSMLVVRVHDGDRPRSNPLLATARLAACGLKLVRRVHGTAGSIQTEQTKLGPMTFVVEPFGFRDGMGQPQVEGLRGMRSGRGQPQVQGSPGIPSGAKQPDPKAGIPLGEFVLGHSNIYRETSHCPEVKVPDVGVPAGRSFGRNGCYLAVQQILQHVEAFRKFETRTQGQGTAAGAPTVAEKLIGRRKDGRPLQSAPRGLEFHDDVFGYRTNDAHGLQCPIGSHIRRANPRDSLLDSTDLRPEATNLHRLLRRGRPFASSGQPDDPAPLDPATAPEVGLFFVAVVADLSRQFEFVKRAWIGNPNFGNLCGEVDPLMGRSTPGCFTVPGQPVGARVESVPPFTTVQGGGYFFLPGRETLGRIAAGDYTTGEQACDGVSAGGTPSPAPPRSSTRGSR
jgi:porphyrinogen peroxidase